MLKSWRKRKYVRWTSALVVQQLKKYEKKLGRSPSIRDVPPTLYQAAVRKFGSWNKAKRAIGLELCRPGRPRGG